MNYCQYIILFEVTEHARPALHKLVSNQRGGPTGTDLGNAYNLLYYNIIHDEILQD